MGIPKKGLEMKEKNGEHGGQSWSSVDVPQRFDGAHTLSDIQT